MGIFPPFLTEEGAEAAVHAESAVVGVVLDADSHFRHRKPQNDGAE